MPLNHPLQDLRRPADPRQRAHFCGRFFPVANGKPVPISPRDKNDRIVLEFACAYYRLNRQYARLLEVRQASSGLERQPRERAQLRAIERALRQRDQLEDFYAPYGVIVEPVMEGGFAVDLKCGFGNVDRRGKPRALLVTLSASVPVPLPPGAKIEDYPISVTMPDLIGSEE